MKKRYALIFVFLFNPSVALSGGVTNVATETTQILNNIQLLQQTLEMIRQLENMVYNTEFMIEEAMGAYGFDELMAAYGEVQEIIQRAEGLAYSMENIDERFAEKFIGYTPVATREEYEELQTGLTETTLDTLKNTLNAAGIQMAKFESESERMELLKNVSRTAGGRNALLSAGNSINAMMMESLADLKQLAALQLQQQNAWMAAQEQRRALDRAERRAYQGEGIEVQPMQTGAIGRYSGQ